MTLILIAHGINIIVAGQMAWLLLVTRPVRMDKVFGPETPARQILGSVYAAIAMMSVWAIVDGDRTVSIALVLFPMQIIYKLLTLPAVLPRNPTSPVPYANLGICVFHGIALAAL